MDILPCIVLNEDFTGVSQSTLKNYLEAYEQLRNLIPNSFYEYIDPKSFAKNPPQTNTKNTSKQNDLYTKFDSLTRNISNKYFGTWRQTTHSKEENVGKERKTCHSAIKAEKEYYNVENVLKKRFLFWIINNYENQRAPHLNVVNQDSTL